MFIGICSADDDARDYVASKLVSEFKDAYYVNNDTSAKYMDCSEGATSIHFNNSMKRESLGILNNEFVISADMPVEVFSRFDGDMDDNEVFHSAMLSMSLNWGSNYNLIIAIANHEPEYDCIDARLNAALLTSMEKFPAGVQTTTIILEDKYVDIIPFIDAIRREDIQAMGDYMVRTDKALILNSIVEAIKSDDYQ